MANDLAQQRCFNHALREAAALCPDCRRFYCRECVSEHDGRMTCAACLAAATTASAAGGRRLLAPMVSVLKAVAAVAILWLMFHLLGRALLSIPPAFHDGTVWRSAPEASP